MFRVPLLCLAIFAAAWLEFSVFPGHTYLAGDSQIYLPMLERMDAPGLLSRDLVATGGGTLSLTAYDEATLLLHEAGRQPFRRALLGQELVCRMAALLGIFLLARATGLGPTFAFVAAALIHLGASLAGPNILLTNREPLPGSFAFSLILLAMGLFVQKLPLLAAVAGGVAFLYDPLLASPYWFILLIAFVFDGKIRPLVRPMLPVFLIFVLLLANLAQLQPGTAAEPLLTRVPERLGLFQRTYAPELYVSAWPAGEMIQTLALLVLGGWALTRCWPILSSRFRWMVTGTALCGAIAIPASYLLVDQGRYAWAARTQPTRTLLFSLAAAALLFALAGMRALLRRSTGEAFAWFFLLFTLPVGGGVFAIWRVADPARLANLALAVALAALLTLLLMAFDSGRGRFVALAAPALAAFAMARTPNLQAPSAGMRAPVAQIAKWADASTWGSSLFLFPDAGRALYPGVFRAWSRHGLWADWTSARGVAFSEESALRWEQRWKETMQDGFSTAALEKMLPLPIDYYVLKREHQLLGPRRTFVTPELVVYDAEDLRNAPKPLRLETDRH